VSDTIFWHSMTLAQAAEIIPFLVPVQPA
jgi:hypothetical protein